MMRRKDEMLLTGDIIEESLRDRSVLSPVTILDTRVEPVTSRHRTPWIDIHRVAIPERRAAEVAKRLSEALDAEQAHAWFADVQYAGVVDHGTKPGTPAYQLDFAPTVERWQG